MRQVTNVAKEAKKDPFFDNVNSAPGEGFIIEQVGAAVMETLPSGSEIVDYGNNVSADFGSHPLIAPGVAPTSTTVNLYGHGTVLTERFPSPFITVRSYYAHQEAITNFIKANPADKALLHFLPGSEGGQSYITFQAAEPITGTPVYHPISPLCLGIVSEWEDEEDAFLIWTASGNIGNIQPIDEVNAVLQMNRSNALVTVAYDSLTRAYNLGRKEMDNGIDVVADSEVRLYSHDGDYVASSMMSHIDLIFPFRQIILTSSDLQQVPERNQSSASSQPILSSYTLSTIMPTAINAQGDAAGGSSEPFGTIYFSESGARRFHSLQKSSGALRRFSIQATITRKNPSLPETLIQLAPSGQFTAQLLFVKKRDVDS